MTYIATALDIVSGIQNYYISGADNYYRFTNLRGDDGRYSIYDWNPCQDFTESSEGQGTECKNVAVSKVINE